MASADNPTDLISRYKSGETVTVTVERQSSGGGYEEKEIEVTLGKKPASSDSTGSSGSSDSSQGQVQQYGGIFGGLYPYMY